MKAIPFVDIWMAQKETVFQLSVQKLRNLRVELVAQILTTLPQTGYFIALSLMSAHVIILAATRPAPSNSHAGTTPMLDALLNMSLLNLLPFQSQQKLLQAGKSTFGI